MRRTDEDLLKSSIPCYGPIKYTCRNAKQNYHATDCTQNRALHGTELPYHKMWSKSINCVIHKLCHADFAWPAALDPDATLPQRRHAGEVIRLGSMDSMHHHKSKSKLSNTCSESMYSSSSIEMPCSATVTVVWMPIWYIVVQCMKPPVAHLLNSTWFWVELLGNGCELLEITMKC